MLDKQYRLNKKPDYKLVFARGTCYVSHSVVIYVYLDAKAQTSQFGFIASKKVGNAVVRNRAKRLMREAVRQNMSLLKGPCRMVCIARSAIRRSRLADVDKSLKYLWRKGKII